MSPFAWLTSIFLNLGAPCLDKPLSFLVHLHNVNWWFCYKIRSREWRLWNEKGQLRGWRDCKHLSLSINVWSRASKDFSFFKKRLEVDSSRPSKLRNEICLESRQSFFSLHITFSIPILWHPVSLARPCIRADSSIRKIILGVIVLFCAKPKQQV